jgi:hypothetical protein
MIAGSDYGNCTGWLATYARRRIPGALDANPTALLDRVRSSNTVSRQGGDLHRHKHNMILSVEDGLLSYFAAQDVNLPYARFGRADLKHRFTYPDINKYVHLKIFGSYVFMLTANKTPLYPEFSDYSARDTRT